jgi:thiamine biosynthesis lipoprotein
MACRFEITLGGEDAAYVAAARQALDEIDGIEAGISAFRATSDLMRVNRSAAASAVMVDRQLLSLLMLCRTIHHDTDGAFDVTSTPLSRCWGFMAAHRNARLPSPEEIDTARRVTGMGRINIDTEHQTVRFARAGVEISFGAIGKGWALDRVAIGLRARAPGHMLLSAGHSSVLAIGTSSRSWPIDLTSLHVTERLARVELRHGSLGTSGAGEQFIEVNGKRYGHVLDPRTGRPTESGLLSVSVLAGEAAVSDALSTAFLVGGIDLVRRYCDAHADVMAVVTSADRRTHIFGDFSGATLTLH